MSTDEIVQILRTIVSKIRGSVGREPFFQIFYDLQKNNPVMLQKIRDKIDDLVIFAITTKSGMYEGLGITKVNDRIILDNIIFNMDEMKLLEMIKKDTSNAILVLNTAFEKSGAEYRVDNYKIEAFSGIIVKLKKIEQATRTLKMIELAEETFACAGYVPRYLTMEARDIAGEGKLLSEGISDAKLSIIDPRETHRLCQEILAKTGHSRDSIKDKDIGLLLEIAARQYIASQAILGLKQTRGEKVILSKEDCINMIAYVILSLKDWQNSD